MTTYPSKTFKHSLKNFDFAGGDSFYLEFFKETTKAILQNLGQIESKESKKLLEEIDLFQLNDFLQKN